MVGAAAKAGDAEAERHSQTQDQVRMVVAGQAHEQQLRPAHAKAGLEAEERQPSNQDGAARVARSLGLGQETVVLVIAHNRPNYLRRCLAALLSHHPAPGKLLPIMISEDQDGASQAQGVRKIIDEYAEKWQTSGGDANSFSHVIFEDATKSRGNGYARLARHYKWALHAVFTSSVKRCIVVEEDLEIAVDFFEIFSVVRRTCANARLLVTKCGSPTHTYHTHTRAHVIWHHAHNVAQTAPLLDDPTENLLAISAFNDDGLKTLVDEEQDAGLLLRSDFFPGLGWMLTSTLWQELEPIWPSQYWDDWLRGPEVRKGRQIIRPEIPRTVLSIILFIAAVGVIAV